MHGIDEPRWLLWPEFYTATSHFAQGMRRLLHTDLSAWMSHPCILSGLWGPFTEELGDNYHDFLWALAQQSGNQIIMLIPIEEDSSSYFVGIVAKYLEETGASFGLSKFGENRKLVSQYLSRGR